MSEDGPTSGEPEYLSSGDPTTPVERRPRSGRRVGLLVGGGIALVGLVGGAVWAWAAYSTSGPQPSEALPADTLGYAAIDLDPSGQQKIEAIRILRKFPAFRDAVDINTDDDLRQRIVEKAIDESGCDLDYADDIEPWLGQRFGVAALPGDDQPDPVFVVQVTDADAADEGLAAVRDCEDSSDSSDSGAWEIRGEWAVVAETQDVATAAADAAAESSLADDADFQEWTEAAGDPGIITAYAAPEAGQAWLESFGAGGSLSFDDEPFPGEGGDNPGEVVAPEAQALASFEGAAMTVRFADGALEAEAAARGTEEMGYLSDTGGDVVTSLPDDTAIALGVGLTEGWGEALLDRVVGQFGGDAEDGVRFAEQSLGLELPEDLEALLGESVALSVGGDLDPAAVTAGQLEVPVGATVRGDAERIEGILDKLRAAVGPNAPEAGIFLQSDSEGDLVSVGPDNGYRQKVLEGGDLGGTDVFEGVVREADRAGMVLFVNFDAGDWVGNLGEIDPELKENLEPLEGAGLSAWTEDDDNHLVFRLSTE